MSSVEERVKKIVVEQLGVNENEVTPASSFVDDLGADSLDTVELVMALEDVITSYSIHYTKLYEARIICGIDMCRVSRDAVRGARGCRSQASPLALVATSRPARQRARF